MATIAIGISKSPTGQYTCKVPVNALAEDGVPPEQGDDVSYSVEGKVQSISGPTATVSIDSINGEPVGEEASESPEEEAAEEGQEGQAGGGGAGGGPAGGGPSGASPKTSLDASMAPMGPAPLRTRLNRAGTNLMRSNLLKGARGRSLPF